MIIDGTNGSAPSIKHNTLCFAYSNGVTLILKVASPYLPLLRVALQHVHVTHVHVTRMNVLTPTSSLHLQ